MKKFVIFDLDGTLVDSIYDLGDCVNTALRAYDLPENTLEEYYSFVGNGIENLIRTSMKSKGDDDELYKKVRVVFDREYKLHSNDKTVPYEGVGEVLHILSEKGISTAVLTNKAEEFVPEILHKAFPSHKFTYAWGQREDIPRKPDPQGLLKLIEESGFELSQCVYIGDSEVDVKTARNAGVDLICVLWGFRSREELVSSGAETLVFSADELLEKILSM